MKKHLILIGVILLLASCSSETKVQNAEAACSLLNQEVCIKNENVCELCGTTKVSSYASCHSKKFCKNTPFE